MLVAFLSIHHPSHQPTDAMISVIFGGTRIGNREAFSSQSFCQTLDILAAHSVTTIDTAQAYGRSEATLGDVHAGDGFTIDTKWSPPSYGPCPAWATRENIIASAENSLQKLRVKVRGPPAHWQ